MTEIEETIRETFQKQIGFHVSPKEAHTKHSAKTHTQKSLSPLKEKYTPLSRMALCVHDSFPPKVCNGR